MHDGIQEKEDCIVCKTQISTLKVLKFKDVTWQSDNGEINMYSLKLLSFLDGLTKYLAQSHSYHSWVICKIHVCIFKVKLADGSQRSAFIFGLTLLSSVMDCQNRSSPWS
jgi:hypothetical protein